MVTRGHPQKLGALRLITSKPKALRAIDRHAQLLLPASRGLARECSTYRDSALSRNGPSLHRLYVQPPAETPANTANPRRMSTRTLHTLLVIGCIAAVFGVTLGHPLVNWDDLRYVSLNPLVNQETPASAWQRLTTPGIGYPIPLPVAIYSLLWQIDPRPWIFHAVNMLVHAFNAWLFSRLIRREIPQFPWVVTFATMAFALHAIVVEPVAWVTGLKDLCLVAGLLLALMAVSRRSVWFVLGACVAMAAKPSGAMVILPIGAALYVAQTAKIGKLSAMRAAFVLAVAAAIVVLRFTATQETNASRTSLDAAISLTEVFGAIGLHVSHLLAPAGLSPLYPRESIATTDWLLGISVVVACAILAVRWIVHRDQRLVWLMVTIGIYLPASNLVPLVRYTADSYMYAPWLGLCGVAALSWPQLATPLRDRPIFAWRYRVAAIVLLGWMALSHLQARSWRSSETLWEGAWQLYPNDGEIIYLYGMALGEAGEKRAEMELYLTHLEALERSIRIPIPLVWWYESQGDLVNANHWLDLGLGRSTLQDNLFYWTYAEFVVRHPERRRPHEEWALRRGLELFGETPKHSKRSPEELRKIAAFALTLGMYDEAKSIGARAKEREKEM